MDAPPRLPQALPVTVLTGFLGSGKTTLVNRILAQRHGRRLAVIVNEFGELGIDAALIRKDSGPVLELSNGCICCATRGDLSQTLAQLLDAAPDLDGILIETSGLADPQPVIDDLENTDLATAIRLDGVVAVIDAANFDRNLDHAEVAYQQITQADLLLVNKVDLVEEGIPERIVEGLRRLNARAGAIPCVECELPLDVLLGGMHRRPELSEPRGQGPVGQRGHPHQHFTSAVLDAPQPLDLRRLHAWLDSLPESVYRLKGFVRLAGSAMTAVVHVVGGRSSIEWMPPAPDDRVMALVAIGRSLAPAELQEGLDRCVAAALSGGSQLEQTCSTHPA